MPAGLLLFACVALPGYRECGRSVAMASDPIMIGLCSFGVFAAIAAIAVPRDRWERRFAIAFTVLALIVSGLFGVRWADADEAYAGLTLATASSLGYAAGGLIWEREARGRPEAAAMRLRWLAPLVLAAWAAIAALSTWHPPPDDKPDSSVPSWFPVVH